MLAPSLLRPSVVPPRPAGHRLTKRRLFNALPAVALVRVARPALVAERPLRPCRNRAVVWFRAGDLRATDHAAWRPRRRPRPWPVAMSSSSRSWQGCPKDAWRCCAPP